MAAKPVRFTLSAEDMLAFENLKPRVDELCEHEVALESRIKALEEGLLMRTAAPSDQQVDRRARVGLAIEKLMLHFDTVVEANLSVVVLLERIVALIDSAPKQVPRQSPKPPKPLEYPDF